MLKHSHLALAAALLALVATALPVRADDYPPKDDEPSAPAPAAVVFQAAGPTVNSIQSVVDQFRAAVGANNNGNTPGPLAEGRREINWDGGGSTDTAVTPNPFTGFLVNRGALFTTLGTGFVQATPAGLAATFGNATYENIFKVFSAPRLFSPIGSNVTEVRFFVPGGGDIAATTTAFGAILTDVDRPDGRKRGWLSLHRRPSTIIEYFGTDGEVLFSSAVPASPGDGSQSFFGIVFAEPLIARVRITTGDAAPGPNDDRRSDIVMMDDFIYGEPRPMQ
jgi:hypothetical protein